MATRVDIDFCARLRILPIQPRTFS